MKWGLIGCGDIAAKSVVPAMKMDDASHIAVCCGRDIEKTRDFAATYHIPHVENDPADLVNRNDVDAVYIAAPPAAHFNFIELASAAGKHILCEKPLCTNRHDAYAAAAICRQDNKTLGVSFYKRFFPQIRKIREWITSGLLGNIRQVKMTCGTWYDPPKGAWRLESTISGGGVLADLGSQRLDLLCFFFGPPSRLFAKITYQRGWPVEDTAVLEMKWDTGLVATLIVSFSQENRSDLLHVYGTRASVLIPDLSSEDVIVRGSDKGQIHHLPVPPRSATHLELIRDFEAAVLERRPPVCSGEDGLLVNRLLDAAYDSGRTSQEVDFLEYLKNF